MIAAILVVNIVGKLIPFNHESLFVLIFIMGAVVWYKNRDIKIDSRILIWLGIIVFYWLVTIVTLSLHGSLGERAMEQLNITHSFIAFSMISVLLFYLRPSIDAFWYLIGIAAVASSVLLVMEIAYVGWEEFTNGVRLGTGYLHPVKMGVFANTVFIIMAGSLLWAYRRGRSFFTIWILLLLATFLTVVFSQTRQAWIGWPEAMIAWGIYYFILFKNRKKISFKQVSLALAFFVLIAAFLIKSPAFSVFEKRITQAITSVENYFDREENAFKTSVGQRLIAFEASAAGISNNFWIGIGENDFREFQTRETSKVALEKFGQNFKGIDYRHLHNQYLMSFLTKGVFGFIGVLLILGFMFWFFVKGLRRADLEQKPIWISGLVFTMASALVFIPDSPFIRSDTAAHFFVFANLLIGFAILSESKLNK